MTHKPLITGLVIGILIILGIIGYPSFKRFLTYYHLLPEPEKLTELYFVNHLSLPNKVELNKTQSFSFAIHNLEYEPKVYPYQVTADDGSTIIYIASGSASLNHDDLKTIFIDYQLASAAARTKVSVTLPDQHQAIDYWLEK